MVTQWLTRYTPAAKEISLKKKTTKSPNMIENNKKTFVKVENKSFLNMEKNIIKYEKQRLADLFSHTKIFLKKYENLFLYGFEKFLES